MYYTEKCIESNGMCKRVCHGDEVQIYNKGCAYGKKCCVNKDHCKYKT